MTDEEIKAIRPEKGFDDLLPLSATRIAPGEYIIKSKSGVKLWHMEGASLAEWVVASINASLEARRDVERLREALGNGDEDNDEGFQVLWYLRQSRSLYDGQRTNEENDAKHRERIMVLYKRVRATLAKDRA